MNDWSDAEQRVERAQELFDQRRWQEALEELRFATEVNPYNAGWFFNMGLTLDALEQYDEAIAAYRQALEIEPEDLHALNHLAIDLHQVGQSDEALEIFARIEQVDAQFEPAYCNRIIVYSELGNHDQAEQTFYLARLYREHCPNCYFNIAGSLAARGLHDKAIYCWRRVLDLDETYPQVHVRIAEALWSKGELEEARKHYLLGLRQDPGDGSALLDMGDLLMEMDRIDEAGEKYRRVIELQPDEAAGHYCHARWLMAAGRNDEAIAAFEAALKLDPRYPGANLHLAQLHHRRVDPERTWRHLRAELALRPFEIDRLMDIANLLMDLGRNRVADACLGRVLRLDPGHVGAWQNMGVIAFLRGDYDRGIHCSLKALELEPAGIAVMHNLALAYERVGHFDQARLWVRRAMQQAPGDPALQKLAMRLRILQIRQKVTVTLRRTLLFWKR